ncbi:acyl-CoA reductase [soil metagenome]
MDLEKRITNLAEWGEKIRFLNIEEKDYLYTKAAAHNKWFTKENVEISIQGILDYLNEENLRTWISGYPITKPHEPKNIGLVLAGNIPLAGFHDFLTVLVSGHHVKAKLSSQDPFLLPYLSKLLIGVEPEFEKSIHFVDVLKDIDAVIATGSDNSSRYFNYYFSKYPHIIRKNRTSCALIRGDETPEEIRNLGDDIFQYFGLGCRNVSKVFVPADYKIEELFPNFQSFSAIKDHHKYSNNYDYHKSVFLVNRVPHLDSGFFIMTETEKLVSPLSVVYYEYYNDLEDLKNKINPNTTKLQCIIAKDGWWPHSIEPGTAQKPQLWNYADGIDTLKFLIELNNK